MKNEKKQTNISFETPGMQSTQRPSDVLYVQTFGTFTLQYAGKKIDCVNNRSKLIWNILAFLISNPGKSVSTETLIENVKGSSGNVSPANAMRTAIFRARQMLDQLIGTPNNQFLISRDGGYMWNPEKTTVVDCMEFDRLMSEVKENPTDIARMLAAFRIYDGKFLALQSSELWVIPQQVRYQGLYETLLDEMFSLLEKRKQYFDAICVCRKALLIDPFSEKNYQKLMHFLLLNNERDEVVKVYKSMSRMMLTDLGVLPDKESRDLYHVALSVSSFDPLSADDIVQDLSEQYIAKGAYTCDYDCFKALYQATARSIERSGIPSHVAILSLIPRNDGLRTQDLSLIMETFEKSMRQSLRRGDIITRCSASQLIALLMNANYENSQRACERVISAFEAQNPDSGYWIDYSVRSVSEHKLRE